MPLYQNINSDTWVNGLRAMGSSIRGVNIGSAQMTANLTLTDNQAKYTAVYLPNPATITGAIFYQVTQGSYTADQNNYIALYTYSSATGVMTQVAISANDGNIWKAASGSFSTVPFTTPYAATSGTYFVGMVYNSSAVVAGPAIGGLLGTLAATSVTYDFPNSGKLWSVISAMNTLPSTQAMSGLTGSATSPWFGIYT